MHLYVCIYLYNLHECLTKLYINYQALNHKFRFRRLCFKTEHNYNNTT